MTNLTMESLGGWGGGGGGGGMLLTCQSAQCRYHSAGIWLEPGLEYITFYDKKKQKNI